MKNNVRWIVSGGILVIIALVVISQYGQNRPSSANSSPNPPPGSTAMPPAMPVAAARVESGAGILAVTAVGSLQANESSVIRSEIAGRITAIPFKEGAPVAKGAVLLMINSEEYEAQVKQIGAVVELDKMNFERAKQLRAEELISDRGYEEAAAKLKESEASFSLAQIRLEKSTLRAPFNGRLGLRQVSPGDYVQPGQAIVTLEETDTMKVDFRVPEIYRGRIDIGRPVQV
ncbi:MAG: efflux RND transporter periplasmic adaptor subunit, partial [Candidatus Manganitrophaceae bacterium]